MRQLLYKLSFNFSISVNLFLPNFFKVAFHFALSFLLDHVILHHVGYDEQIVGVLEFGGLSFHENTQNLAQDVGKAQCVGDQCYGDVKGL